MRWKGKKAKAWQAVRAYIKSVETDCCTCGAKDIEGRNAQAGHFLPVALVGSNNTLSWDFRQIHLQCSHCNGAGQGMQVAYRTFLVKKYGEEVVAELEARRWKTDPIKNWDDVIAHYEALL